MGALTGAGMGVLRGRGIGGLWGGGMGVLGGRGISGGRDGCARGREMGRL